MNLSTWAIQRPVPSILLFLALTVAGIVGVHALPVQNFPDIDFPTVTITGALPGATPSTLETEVTRKIEDSLASIGSVQHITSTVNDGVSVTTVEFELEKNMQEAVNDVRNAVDGIRANLPTEMPDPVVSRVNTVGGAVLSYSIASKTLDEAELSWFVDNDISKTLLALPGVGKITRIGGIDREVRVELDPTRLLALNVTASEISSQLRSVQQEAPGGRGDVGGLEQAVRTIGTVTSAEDVAALEIPLTDGRHILLSSVASVLDTGAERRQLALIDGQPAVTFQVLRARGASEVAVGERTRAALDAFAAAHPQIALHEINNSIAPIRRDYIASIHTLLEGAVLAVLVVWLFLRDWRATFVSAVALPLSIIPTFAAIALLGFQLNTVTLLAITLVVGVLVDDAIVEVENIVRHLRGGKTPRAAAMDAATEIGLAVIATSLTLVAVFLPTAFMGGITGRFFKQFGWTASIAVLASLLVARLLTPMMSAYLLRPLPEPRGDGRVMQHYLRAVRWSLAHPWRVSAFAAVFFVASMSLTTLLTTTFLIPEDVGQVNVSVEAPPGSTLAQTRSIAQSASKILAGNAEVTNVYTTIGSASGGGFGGGGNAAEVRRADLVAALTPSSDRRRSQQQIEEKLRSDLLAIPGARFSVGGGGGGQNFSLVLSGEDQGALVEAAQRVITDIRTLPGLGNIRSSASLLRPEIIVRPDFVRAGELGVSAAAIGQAVRVATTGDYDQNLPRLNLPARQIYIRTEIDPSKRDDIDMVRSLRVVSRKGTVPLESIASVSIEGGPAQIDRYDRNRNVSIEIELQGMPLGEASRMLDRLPSLKNLPPGVNRMASGDAERLQELFGGFGLAIAAGVLCVLMVLIVLFGDFVQPFTILAALPLSVGGAFAALAIFHYSLSLASLIGLVMLMGIVTKNSILLVEYAIIARRERGLPRTEAILDACHKRARPIVMTTIAMVAGMLPMALNLEGSSSLRSPMAAAVIGGLVTSTALSLLVIPVLFEVFDDGEMWLRRRLGLKGEKPAAASGPPRHIGRGDILDSKL
jgi:hydrophobe/amphiphile efflux-1 (HAE1) family protein